MKFPDAIKCAWHGARIRNQEWRPGQYVEEYKGDLIMYGQHCGPYLWSPSHQDMYGDWDAHPQEQAVSQSAATA